MIFCILLGIAFYADCELGRLRDDINKLNEKEDAVSEYVKRLNNSKGI
ncbi:hypothetical protein [Bacillus sp. CCNWLW75]